MPKGVKGGPQEGSGRPKGSKNQKTLDLEWERELIRRHILRRVGPMTDAQCNHAEGVSYMVLRNSDGTFTRATDEKQIDAACAIGASAFRIFTQAPNPQAYSTLMAYAVDRPKEQPQSLKVNVTTNIVDTLRQRYAKRKKAE